jgi:hypothetical protein
MVPLYGTKEEVATLRGRVERVLGSISPTECKIEFLDHNCLSKNNQHNTAKTTDLRNTLDHFCGKLTGYGLPRAYWRSDMQSPTDPFDIDLDADCCGVSTISLSCPLDGKHISTLASLVKETLLSYGFDPLISFSAVRPRIFQLNAFICFNRRLNLEELSAAECRQEVLKRATQQGYYPNRLDISSMHLMALAMPGQMALATRVKRALDSNLIFAPNRYFASSAHHEVKRM